MTTRNAAFLAIAAFSMVLVGMADGRSPAANAAPQSRQCFLASRVNGYSSVSDTLVDVKVGANDYYRLTLDGACPDAAFRTRVVMRTLSGGSYICQGLDAEIVVPSAGGAERCLVRAIQPITKSDWQADSRRK
jgi:Family of unknown function (DUF6491)